MSKVKTLIENDLGKLRFEEEGGLIFLHFTVKKWGKDTLALFREELERVLLHFKALGHDVIFMYSSEKKSVKFWQLVKPCFTVEPLGNSGYLGAWLTEEINDGN
jgi:hypothetical protein